MQGVMDSSVRRGANSGRSRARHLRQLRVGTCRQTLVGAASAKRPEADRRAQCCNRRLSARCGHWRSAASRLQRNHKRTLEFPTCADAWFFPLGLGVSIGLLHGARTCRQTLVVAASAKGLEADRRAHCCNRWLPAISGHSPESGLRVRGSWLADLANRARAALGTRPDARIGFRRCMRRLRSWSNLCPNTLCDIRPSGRVAVATSCWSRTRSGKRSQNSPLR